MTAADQHRFLPPFTGARIDRASDLRASSEELRSLLAREDLMAIAADAGNVLVDQAGARLARVPWHGDAREAVMLGVEDGHPLLAVDLESLAAGERDQLLSAGKLLSLREAGTELPQAESGLAAYLAAMASWHRRNGFCSVCGTATNIVEGGLSRRCPNCGASHFPRTDPVVIMTVEHGDRLLLGQRAGWVDRFSVLAGFVAPGETPEEAVIREVAEESGIVCHSPAYVGSQPWPFPASLMLGFDAWADGGDPAPGADGEMTAVRWFTLDEIQAAQRGETDFALPGEVSIARLLIDRWVERQLG